MGNQQDCQALDDIYNQLSGSSWWNTTNWQNATVDCCLRAGIECNADGRVRKLYDDFVSFSGFASGIEFEKFRMQGRLPDSIGKLTELEHLLIVGNDITGPIPDSFAQLKKLKFLYLYENQLTGPIPAFIYDLPVLHTLSLWDNRLTGPLLPAIGQLTNLHYLAIANNYLTGEIPSEIGNLQSLIDVTVYGNLWRGSIPASLSSLAALNVSLGLTSNRPGIEDFSCIDPEFDPSHKCFRVDQAETGAPEKGNSNLFGPFNEALADLPACQKVPLVWATLGLTVVAGLLMMLPLLLRRRRRHRKMREYGREDNDRTLSFTSSISPLPASQRSSSSALSVLTSSSAPHGSRSSSASDGDDQLTDEEGEWSDEAASEQLPRRRHSDLSAMPSIRQSVPSIRGSLNSIVMDIDEAIDAPSSLPPLMHPPPAHLGHAVHAIPSASVQPLLVQSTAPDTGATVLQVIPRQVSVPVPAQLLAHHP
ncbi:hypothetical protein RI367_003598 [Sorochytrium milnesiophthora]